MARHPGACAFKIRTHQLRRHCVPAVERPGAGIWSSLRGSVTRRHWLKRHDRQRRQHLLPPGSRQAVAAVSRDKAAPGPFVFGDPWLPWLPRRCWGPVNSLRNAPRGPPSSSPKHTYRVSLWRLGSSLPLLETYFPCFLDDVPRRDVESVFPLRLTLCCVSLYLS